MRRKKRDRKERRDSGRERKGGERERKGGGRDFFTTQAGNIGAQLSSICTEPLKELSMLRRAGAKDKCCYGN